MKPNPRLRLFLAALGAASLGLSSASAADVTWDVTPGTVGTGNGTITGGDGTWNTTNGNWTTDAGVNNIAWNNANNDVAIFGGTAGIITLGSDITIGGMTFNTDGYSITPGAGPYKITLGLASAPINVSTGTTTINAEIAGTTVAKDGAGTLNLAGTNTYSGLMTINAGTLILSGSNSNTGGVSVVNGSTLQLNGGSVGGTLSLSSSSGGTLQAINADRSIANLIQLGGGPGIVSGNYSITTSNSLRVFNGNRTLTNNLATGKSLTVLSLAANAASGRDLTIDGSGKTIVTGASSFGGGTNKVFVNGGVLILNGALTTGGVTVGASGTLGGTGTIGGSTTINGTYSAGADVATVGTQNFSNTLNLNGTTIMEIDGNAGAGINNGHDFVNLMGLAAAGVLTYGGNLTLDIGTLFTAGNYSWNLFDFASESSTFSTITLADKYSGSLLDADLDGVWELSSGSNTWTFTESSGVLGLAVVPEPEAALLAGLGMLLLLRRRRH